MYKVRLHLDGLGVLWLMAKCRTCGEVHKYLATEVATGDVRCKACNRIMNLEGASFAQAGALPLRTGDQD